MPTKRRISGSAILIKWWDGPPVLVIVPCPPEPAIQLRTERARGYVLMRIPSGPIEARSLTKKEKRFLLSKGMPANLVNSGRVFAISKEAAGRFDTDRKAFVELAKQCGLSEDDLLRITEAKRRLGALRAATYDERRAVRGLREFLNSERPKKERGRPGKITVEDRLRMHAEADQLRQEGKTASEIVRALAQRYELRYSYAKRILEDASHTVRSNPT
jgi:hypothetical protein